MRIFDKAAYRFSTEEEPEEHKEARLYVEALIVKNGIENLPKPVYYLPINEEESREYKPDIFCRDNGQLKVIEIDGDSHKDDLRELKDAIRDQAFAARKIPSIRIEVEEVIGKYRISDAEILKRIKSAVIIKA